MTRAPKRASRRAHRAPTRHASWRALWLALLTCVLVVLAGCDPRRTTPELLSLTDVGPRMIRPGDQLMIVGHDLPVGQVRDATVLFVGKVHRPGEPGTKTQTIEVAGAELAREGVRLTVDETLLARFCGSGDEARHATFSGRVEVWLPSAGRLPVFGSLKGDVAIDFLPRKASQRTLTERADIVKETEELLGARFVETIDEEIALNNVAKEGLLGRAGAMDGDVVTTIDDLTVFARDDMMLRADGKFADFQLVRGDAAVRVAVPTDAFRGVGRNQPRIGIVILGAVALVVFALFGPLAAWVRWLATRVREARDERERGLFALGLGRQTPFAAPIVFVSLAAAFAMFPIVELRLRTPLDLSLLYVITLSARFAAALVTGGWGEGGFVKRRVVGLAYTVLSELPAVLALGGAFALSGGLLSKDLVELQSPVGPSFLETGGQPWHWLAFRNPLLAGLFSMFFLTSLVDRAPGRSSGLKLLTWVHLFVVSGVGTIVFLGGYALPGVAPAELARSPWLQLLGAACFLLKAVTVSLAALALRRALPNMAPRAFLVVTRNVVLPAAILAGGFSVATTLYPPLPSALRTMTLVILVGVVVGTALFTVVVRAGGPTRARVRINPFL